MKKNVGNILLIFIMIIISFKVLKERTLVIESVKQSFGIWENNIFPSLFPFLIIGNILISLGFPEILGELFKNIFSNLFKINKNGIFIIFLSMLSGFPSSSKYIKELLDKNLIDSYDATKLLTFTHFSNPLFILGTITIFVGDYELGIPILISHYLGNLIIGLMLRNYNRKDEVNTKINIKNVINNLKIDNFGNILTKSISSGINTLLLILGSITIFLILTSILNNMFNISELYKPINGIFEMTNGLKTLETLNISHNIKGLIAVMIISFGGLSVHLQTITIISETKIKYFPYFICRIFHSIISGLIFFIWKVL